MADNKAPADQQLDAGFNEVPLDEGFQEVPLTPGTPAQASPGQPAPSLYQKFANMGQNAINSAGQALKTGVETTADLGRGMTQGLSLGFSDEAIAAAKASMEAKPGSDEWKKLYKQYHDVEEAKLKASQERSPVASTVGEIGGAILPALVTAGATAPESAVALGGRLAAKQIAKNAAEAAAKGVLTGGVTGGIYSAGKSQGSLLGTPQDQQKLAQDTANGVVTGGVLGGVLGGATKAAPELYNAVKDKTASNVTNYIADSPFWRQAQKAKDLGEQGVNIYSREAKYGPIGQTSGLINQDTNATRDLVDRIYKVDQKLGQNIGSAIDNATDQGITVSMTNPMMQSVGKLKNLMETDQTLAANPATQKLQDTIFGMGDFDSSKLSPKTVQSLRSDVIDFADSIKQKNPDVASLAYQFANQTGNALKETIPEYKNASERFEQFRRLVPETIISGPTPVDISGVKLGSLKNDEAKLFNATKSMIQGAEVPGTGSSGASETFKNFINGLNDFDKAEAERLANGTITKDDLPKLVDNSDPAQAADMEKAIRDKADQSALLRQAWRVNPQEGISTSVKGATFGRGGLLNIANKYGLYKDTLTKPVRSPIALTKNLYSASEDQLRNVADKMGSVPGLSKLGESLTKGLDNKDSTGVNAAIFSIMQNPQARILVNGEDDLNKENQ